jgi:hypothetical protein
VKIAYSPIRPSQPADWYDPARGCRHCRAEVVKRREHTDGTVGIEIAHHSRCPAVLGEATKTIGRADQMRGRKPRTTSDVASPGPAR